LGTEQFFTNVALTDAAAASETEHRRRVHAPDQPANAEPLAAFAFRVTELP
jgi:hypothetical protein